MELMDLEQIGSNIIGRKTEIIKKLETAKDSYPIEFRGQSERLPVIRVRIGFPVYRLMNGRTSTYQLEYLALHPNLPEDFFKRDNDAISAQKAQDEVLRRLVDEENLLNSFKEELQVQPLICTNTGVVVNGNRRLCAWRMLYLSDQILYKRFETIEIAILPECDESEIVTLEEKLQIQREKRAEYKWHAKAMMALQREQSGLRHSEVARAFDMSSQKLTLLFEALNYASKYLQALQKENQWSLVDKDYYAFEKLVKNVRRFTNQGDQELFEIIVFSMIENGSLSGRLYDVIDDVAVHFEAIKAELAKKNNIEFLPEEENPFDELAGEHIAEESGSKLTAVIRDANSEEKAKIMNNIRIVIENENAIRNEIEAATYLIVQVSRAASLLRAAADQGLNERSDAMGVKEQLDTIKTSISEIEDWLEKR